MQEKTLAIGKIKAKGSIVFLCSGSDPQGPRKSTEWARFVKNVGIEDDAHSPDLDRQVGIFPWEALSGFSEKACLRESGQCGENVCITSGDLSTIEPGDFLGIGKALLVVTQLGKCCQGPCPMNMADPMACPISKGWIYGRVIKSGQVCIDDAFVAVGSTQKSRQKAA